MYKGMKIKISLLVVLSALILFMAGCQAVGGVDLNSMLKQSLKITSGESNETVSFKMSLTDAAKKSMTAEELELYNLFTNFTLRIDEAKMEDASHQSIKGALVAGGTTIGFSLQADAARTVLRIDGAKRPVVLNTGSSSNGSSQSLQALGIEMIDTASGYFINNMPNPKGLSVTPVQDTVNGEKLSLMNVHTEWNGQKLIDWAQSYIDILVEDNEGRTAIITSILELLAANQDAFEAVGEENIFDNQGKINGVSIKDTAATLSLELGKQLKEMRGSLDYISLPADDQIALTSDLFVDSKLNIRKSKMVLSMKPTKQTIDEEELFFNEATLTISSENLER